MSIPKLPGNNTSKRAFSDKKKKKLPRALDLNNACLEVPGIQHVVVSRSRGLGHQLRLSQLVPPSRWTVAASPFRWRPKGNAEQMEGCWLKWLTTGSAPQAARMLPVGLSLNDGIRPSI